MWISFGKSMKLPSGWLAVCLYFEFISHFHEYGSQAARKIECHFDISHMGEVKAQETKGVYSSFSVPNEEH